MILPRRFARGSDQNDPSNHLQPIVSRGITSKRLQVEQRALYGAAATHDAKEAVVWRRSGQKVSVRAIVTRIVDPSLASIPGKKAMLECQEAAHRPNRLAERSPDERWVAAGARSRGRENERPHGASPESRGRCKPGPLIRVAFGSLHHKVGGQEGWLASCARGL